MTKTISTFSKYTDGGFESKTHTIISSITGNAYFPTPVPAIATVQVAADTYSAALIKASTGNRSDIAFKNEKREELTGLLRSLSTYVNLTANGDRTMLLSSGFDVTKEREPVVIAKPENLKVENGNSSGELAVSVAAVKGAYAYLHEYTTDVTMAPGNWVSTPGTTSKGLFSNLNPGTKYYCRVGAVGSNGQLLYSDAVARIVV
jgi:hypothetical protein